jgi:uncharacterized iron-regulated membrane protein
MLAKVKLLIDLVALLVLIVLSISGFVLWFGLDGGPRRGQNEDSWGGLARNDWTDLHDGFAVAFLALMAVHIVINFHFVVVTAKSLFAGDKAAG